MSEMTLPKYVHPRKGSLYYQRDYPTRLKHLIAKKTYSASLGIKVNKADDVSVSKAVAHATEAYELHLKLIENSDPEAFTADEVGLAALGFLRQRRLKPGDARSHQVAGVREGEDSIAPDSDDLAGLVIPEFSDVLDKNNRGEVLNVQDEVVVEARRLVMSAAKNKPKTFGSLWQYYVEYRGLDLSSRTGKRSSAHWNRWLAEAGNHGIALDSLDRIHEGLDGYVGLRQNDGVKGASISRELNEVIACLRHCSKRFRFGWVIEPPAIPKGKPKTKAVMTLEQQCQLIEGCGEVVGGDAPVAASIIMMLQGAMMPSEIGRLRPEDILLEGETPLVIIRNETKTEYRKRIVPLVLEVDYLKEHLEAAVGWIARTTDSTPSARIKKLMRSLTGIDTLTGHCCRHTFRLNCEIKGVSATTVAAIGGWSGSTLGVSSLMLKYGKGGLAHTEVVQRLREESLKIHSHLL